MSGTETLRAYFGGLLEYDRFASGRALESVESVPLEKRTADEFKRALGILSHVQLARRIWLTRLDREVARPTDWFPAWETGFIRSESAALDALWAESLRLVPESGFEREVRYTSSEGVSYASSVSEIWTHVVNHGTYHRGQVARLVHLLGGERATTDAIAFTRRRL